MVKFVVRRLLATLPLILIVTFVVMLLASLRHTDPAETIAGEGATREQVRVIRQLLGLDDNVFVRYGKFLRDAAHGSLGTSLYSSEPVLSAISSRWEATTSLAAGGFLLSLLVGIPAGIAAAVRKNRATDRTVSALAALLMAVPPFVVGIMLVVLFAVQRDWFPVFGYVPPSESISDWMRHLVLPSIALAATPAALTARHVRAALADALEEDFVRTARAKGLLERSVVLKHAGKYAAIPVVTVLGLNIAGLLSGAVVVERVFSIPGLGSLAVDSVLRGDLPVIQGIVTITAVTLILINLLVDLSYGFFNPQLRR
jgi:peptide/nickel transport system permease protein